MVCLESLGLMNISTSTSCDLATELTLDLKLSCSDSAYPKSYIEVTSSSETADTETDATLFAI